MSREEHWRKLEEMYRSAPINAYWAPRISVGDGVCDIVIPIRRDFFHAANAAHGVTYFKALDDAAWFAANSLVDEFFMLTTSFHLTFLRPIASGELHAHGTVVQSTKNVIFAEAVARDSEGREIGRGSGVFVPSKLRLTPDLGYR